MCRKPRTGHNKVLCGFRQWLQLVSHGSSWLFLKHRSHRPRREAWTARETGSGYLGQRPDVWLPSPSGQNTQEDVRGWFAASKRCWRASKAENRFRIVSSLVSMAIRAWTMGDWRCSTSISSTILARTGILTMMSVNSNEQRALAQERRRCVADASGLR